MDILNEAIILAVNRHSGMTRKGTDIPYIVHPLEAVSIAAGITEDREVLAAAVLHDVIEDTQTSTEEIKELFGERVAFLVAAESEDKMSEFPASETWKIRKTATVEPLKTASFDEKVIVLSDKLSNIRAIYRDSLNLGDRIWDRFNQKDKKMHEWYYRAIAKSLTELSEYAAFSEYCHIVDEVFTM